MLTVVIRVIRVKLSKFLPVVGKLIVIAMAGHKDYFDDPGRARRPGTRVVVDTRADEVTRQAVAGLLRGEGADARFSCWDSHQRQRAELGPASLS